MIQLHCIPASDEGPRKHPSLLITRSAHVPGFRGNAAVQRRRLRGRPAAPYWLGLVHRVRPSRLRRPRRGTPDKQKKPTWSSTRRYTITPAYSLASHPAQPGCPLFSHPTTSTRFSRRAKSGPAHTPQSKYYIARTRERKQLLMGWPVLETMVLEATGSKALSMHHDVSTITGEEVELLSLAEAPLFRAAKKTYAQSGP